MSSIDLFDFPVGMPLAARMRPAKLEDFIGQGAATASSGPLASLMALHSSSLSVILYGPPGTGKTSLARILGANSGREILEVSAISSSIADLRNAFARSQARISEGFPASIVFIDEIHRFSRVQQEAALKAVEEGLIVLIGATTENPRFALSPAILSRSTLVELHPLADVELTLILNRALADERGLAGKYEFEPGTAETIAVMSGGDARKALSILETMAVSASRNNTKTLSLELLNAVMPVALARYDATGDQHYDVISAFIKSVRGSDPDAALHYLARMIVGGEDPRFIARRLVILAAEDIGLADPNAITITNSVMSVVSQIGMPEGRIPLAEATIYLALAPKSNSAYLAINKAIQEVEAGFSPQIPNYLRSNPVHDDEDYEYPHESVTGITQQKYLSTQVSSYYQAKLVGFESSLATIYEAIKKARNQA